MNWKDPLKQLPPIDKKTRCLAFIVSKTEEGIWKGYCDVYFSSVIGWRRCEKNEQVEIIKWIFIEDLGDPSEDTYENTM
jgi:hypothetical protein